MSDHDKLVEKAKEAINRVFNDRSVSPQQTRTSLIDLNDEIAVLLDTLPEDDDE